MPSWERLRVLLAVVETGTVNAAAERLKVSPSAVSQMLRRFEKDVGRPLIRRTPRQMEPTTEGLALAERARMIEAILAECEAMFAPDTVRPGFMLGVSADLAATLLPPALAELDSAPGAPRVALRVHGSATLEEMFARGELDGAIVSRGPGRVSGRDLLLWEENLVWATAPQPNWAEGGTLPLVLQTENCLCRDLAMEALRDWGGAWRVEATGNSVLALLTIVRSGRGVTPLPPSTLLAGIAAAEGDLPRLGRVAFVALAAGAREFGVMEQLCKALLVVRAARAAPPTAHVKIGSTTGQNNLS